MATVLCAPWQFHEIKAKLNPRVSFSDEVNSAANDAFADLHFPLHVTDAYMEMAKRQLTVCLNQCLTKGQPLNALVRAEKRTPLCFCIENETMKGLPRDQFLGNNRTSDNQTRALQLFRLCLATYKMPAISE